MPEEEKNSTTKPVAVLVNMSPEERLRRDIYRPDMEKLQLFTRMLRNNELMKKAVITYK